MGRIYGWVALGVLTWSEGPATAEGPGGENLAVRVTDVKGRDGQVMIALFNKADGFPANFAKAARLATVAADKPEFIFENLPKGNYVVVAAHDRNGNGEIDKSAVGLPLEPIGLSNHAKISPPANMPNFEKAKVEVSRNASVQVNLIELLR